MGKIPSLSHIFQMGWNYQPVLSWVYHEFEVFQWPLYGKKKENLRRLTLKWTTRNIFLLMALVLFLRLGELLPEHFWWLKSEVQTGTWDRFDFPIMSKEHNWYHCQFTPPKKNLTCTTNKGPFQKEMNHLPTTLISMSVLGGVTKAPILWGSKLLCFQADVNEDRVKSSRCLHELCKIYTPPMLTSPRKKDLRSITLK